MIELWIGGVDPNSTTRDMHDVICDLTGSENFCIKAHFLNYGSGYFFVQVPTLAAAYHFIENLMGAAGWWILSFCCL